MADNSRPKIADTVDNMDNYDTLFIGYPNWWGDMPMIVYNFLERYNLSGKTIVPFCTHGGSGLSNTESTIADITEGKMKDGFAIPGTTAQNDRDTARNNVTVTIRITVNCGILQCGGSICMRSVHMWIPAIS